jgi:hypothetical protein
MKWRTVSPAVLHESTPSRHAHTHEQEQVPEVGNSFGREITCSESVSLVRTVLRDFGYNHWAVPGITIHNSHDLRNHHHLHGSK